jgi:hypothetical protein
VYLLPLLPPSFPYPYFSYPLTIFVHLPLPSQRFGRIVSSLLSFLFPFVVHHRLVLLLPAFLFLPLRLSRVSSLLLLVFFLTCNDSPNVFRIIYSSSYRENGEKEGNRGRKSLDNDLGGGSSNFASLSFRSISSLRLAALPGRLQGQHKPLHLSTKLSGRSKVFPCGRRRGCSHHSARSLSFHFASWTVAGARRRSKE